MRPPECINLRCFIILSFYPKDGGSGGTPTSRRLCYDFKTFLIIRFESVDQFN